MGAVPNSITSAPAAISPVVIDLLIIWEGTLISLPTTTFFLGPTKLPTMMPKREANSFEISVFTKPLIF